MFSRHYPGLFVKANSDLFMPGDNKWQNLNAEVINHYEVGVSQRYKDWAKLDFTFFFDEGKDRIVVATPPTRRSGPTSGLTGTKAWKAP